MTFLQRESLLMAAIARSVPVVLLCPFFLFVLFSLNSGSGVYSFSLDNTVASWYSFKPLGYNQHPKFAF